MAQQPQQAPQQQQPPEGDEEEVEPQEASARPSVSFEYGDAGAFDLTDDFPIGNNTFQDPSIGSDDQRPDSQGRISLSADHRRYAGLTKECVVVGSRRFLEIWDAEAWEHYQAQHEDDYAQPQSESLKAIF